MLWRGEDENRAEQTLLRRTDSSEIFKPGLLQRRDFFRQGNAWMLHQQAFQQRHTLLLRR